MKAINLIFILSLLSTLFAQNIGDKFEKAKVIVTRNNPTSNKLTISQATIKAINEARAKRQICSEPVTPLRWNQTLYKYAKEHTIDMAVTKKLSHDGSGTKTDITAKVLGLKRGSHFYERVNQKVNSKAIRSGELVIRSDINSLKTPKELINYWIQIPNDCKVIMDSRFSDVALAKVVDNKNKKAYWTLLLAGSRAPKTKK